jgi:RNA polymerase sigma factor for flagellar operon FliA
MPQNHQLWQRYKLHSDSQAREELILAYSYLAKYVVDRIHVRPTAAMGYDDLVGYAIVGLMDAVEKFDITKDVKFETYAMTRIRGAVLDAIKSMDWLPRSVRASGNELRRVMVRLEVELGRPPLDEEISEAMGISVDELNTLLADMGHTSVLSLEELVLNGAESDVDAGVGVSNALGRDPLESVELEARRDLLVKAISELPEREKLVVSLYYREGLTFKEIGQVLSVTESRICQMHSKAVARMHGKLARHIDLMVTAA